VTEMLGEQQGSHASAGETAFMLAVRPDAVNLDCLSGNDAPVEPSREITTCGTSRSTIPMESWDWIHAKQRPQWGRRCSTNRSKSVRVN